MTRVKSVTGRGRKPVVDFELIVLLKWVKRVIVRVMVEWRAVLARAAHEGEVDSISVSGEADRAEAIVKVAIVNGGELYLGLDTGLFAKRHHISRFKLVMLHVISRLPSIGCRLSKHQWQGE